MAAAEAAAAAVPAAGGDSATLRLIAKHLGTIAAGVPTITDHLAAIRINTAGGGVHAEWLGKDFGPRLTAEARKRWWAVGYDADKPMAVRLLLDEARVETEAEMVQEIGKPAFDKLIAKAGHR